MKEEIRLRACLAVVRDGGILLVPRYDFDGSAAQWNIPGGGMEFGEGLEQAAMREFEDQTGLEARINGGLTVSEVIVPEWSSHVVTVTFLGGVTSAVHVDESENGQDGKTPKWFSVEDLQDIEYYPKTAVDMALSLRGTGAPASSRIRMETSPNESLTTSQPAEPGKQRHKSWWPFANR